MFEFSEFTASGRPFENVRGNALHLLTNLPAESIDSFVTDPPYGIELKLGTRKKGIADSIAGDGRLEARRLWRQWVPLAHRAAKPDTLHIVFGSYDSGWQADTLRDHFDIKGCIVWDKKVPGLGYFMRRQWELAYLVAKGKPKPRVFPGPTDVWQFQRLMQTRHPCEKPVQLLRQAVRITSRPGDVIVDMFSGIASTGVAAVEEGRRFIGCEINKRHWRLGVQRCQQAVAATNGA
jgi:DNA modification methylase